MKFTEEKLKKFSSPISNTEEIQCKNAINMVISALENLGFITENGVVRSNKDTPSYESYMTNNKEGYKVKIFLQGSYANNTNVRGYSDIDVVVVQEDIFNTKYRVGIKDEDYGFCIAPKKLMSFKDIVESALKNKFGSDVQRNNKSIRINGNSYRKDADAVPSIRYRDYSKDFTFNKNNYEGGIIINADDGNKIINFPEQHLKNGIEKNKYTKRRFKKMVRIAKELRYQMKENGIESANKINSFVIECLLYNIPDNYFLKHESFIMTFEEIVNYLYVNCDKIVNFVEVNKIKKLCPRNSETEEISIEFIKELRKFYSYEA